MTQTMLERAARALCTCDEQDGGGPWGFHSAEYQEGYRERARAVLMAVRESDEAMSQAVRTTEGWEDMIDAILNEKDTTND